MTEHVVTEVSIQRYTMEIRPNHVTEDVDSMDQGLEFQDELRHKYECSCGDKFLKRHTAHKHLLEVSESDTYNEATEGDQ